MDFVIARDSPRMQFALLAAVLKWRRDGRRFAEEIALTLITHGEKVMAVLLGSHQKTAYQKYFFTDPLLKKTHGS